MREEWCPQMWFYLHKITQNRSWVFVKDSPNLAWYISYITISSRYMAVKIVRILSLSVQKHVPNLKKTWFKRASFPTEIFAIMSSGNLMSFFFSANVCFLWSIWFLGRPEPPQGATRYAKPPQKNSPAQLFREFTGAEKFPDSKPKKSWERLVILGRITYAPEV